MNDNRCVLNSKYVLNIINILTSRVINNELIERFHIFFSQKLKPYICTYDSINTNVDVNITWCIIWNLIHSPYYIYIFLFFSPLVLNLVESTY